MSGSRVLFVGGYPKGCAEPFGEQTISGKRLRGMVAQFPFDVVRYVDLWIDRLQEEEGKLWPNAEEELLRFQKGGFQIVALGRRVEKAMKQNMRIPFIYLPHPAARRKKDLQTLREGIAKLAGESRI